jgi:hypothetical protein
LLPDLLGWDSFLEIIPEISFDPDQRFIGIPAMLDHVAGHRKEMNGAVFWICQF